jgi:uncharacterized protein YigA (DUF484 family)
MTAKLDSHLVALYLEDNPHFFEEYPELMAGLRLTTPLGGRTVSLQERQLEVMREKVKLLELKLVNLTRVAKDNDAIIEKFHQWVRTLFMSRDEADLPEALLQAIRDAFGVPGASLRLWTAAQEDAWFAAGDLAAAHELADQLEHPYCGTGKGKAGVEWLDDAANMQSVALVALRKPDSKQSFGLLVLGSPDPQRFSAELATDFLGRIGATASAALQGLLPE